MWRTILIAFVILAAFLFFWIVFYKKEDKEKPVQFSCHHCDEKDCTCTPPPTPPLKGEGCSPHSLSGKGAGGLGHKQ